VEPFVFFQFKQEHVGLALRLAQLNREFACIVAGLIPQIIELFLLLVEFELQLAELLLLAVKLVPKLLKLYVIHLFLLLERLSNALLFGQLFLELLELCHCLS